MASHRRTLNRQSSSRCLLSYVFFFLGSSLHVNCYPGDVLKHGEFISGSRTLVSAGGTFELRLFTTRSNITSPKTFVGICYKWDRDTVVWVANRDNPLPADFTGVFGIAEDGNLKVLDGTGKQYWSTTLERPSFTNRTVKLMDSGNLVLSDDHMPTSLWESFKNPTDTFLSGMKMDENLTLTSWQDDDDPRSGLYTFKLDQQGEGHYVVSKKSLPHWKGRMPGKFSSSDEMPYVISYLLSKYSLSVIHAYKSYVPKNPTKQLLTNRSSDFTRMVMNNTGQLQYLTWDKTKRIWSLTWSKPVDECGIYNYCGKFGSCNIDNWPLLCKCLPGFKPTNPVAYWDLRDFSGGCTRNSASTNFEIFLSLKMMKVSDPNSDSNVANKTECEKEYCLKNSQCVAYSYQEAGNSTKRGDTTTVSNNICWVWNEYIGNLQEYPDQGRNLSVRVAKADIESTARTCKPCGTYTIPYPLSTGQDCGDPMYFIFDCNTSSGQVSFKAPDGPHRVVGIDPSTRNFVIQVEFQEYIDARNSRIMPWLNESLPFFSISTFITDIGNSIDQLKGRANAPKPNPYFLTELYKTVSYLSKSLICFCSKIVLFNGKWKPWKIKI